MDGEIDLIAQDETHLIFAEVKTRMEGDKNAAALDVSRTKRDKLRKTAYRWMQTHTHDLQPRFDVIEVYLTNDRRVFVRYLAGAFEGKEE